MLGLLWRGLVLPERQQRDSSLYRWKIGYPWLMQRCVFGWLGVVSPSHCCCRRCGRVPVEAVTNGQQWRMVSWTCTLAIVVMTAAELRGPRSGSLSGWGGRRVRERPAAAQVVSPHVVCSACWHLQT
mmetsp:Transcript_16936/g.46648  ORF Transcript_16936/g.46648 Transcript_16936/m.46648 type:complete len:127 (-) Transcript_16936:1204-1584(-)